jgi:hypothetical protein
MRQDKRNNVDIAQTIGDRPPSSDYLDGLKNINLGYIPGDI